MGLGVGARAVAAVLACLLALPGPCRGAEPDPAWSATTILPKPAPAGPASVHKQLVQGTAGAPTAVLIGKADLAVDGQRTTFYMELSKGLTAEVFTLANPYRVIVDLPNASFKLPEGTGRAGQGLVAAFRYGLFAEGKARVVLDTTGPVRIERAAMTTAPGRKLVLFAIDLVATTAESFGAGTGANRAAKEAQSDRASHERAVPPPERPRAARAKPVVMVDPGHGGIDPGAVGASNLLEKNVVLAVGLKLQKALAAGGRYDVRLTRTSDVFVSLNRRLKLSREAGAELFVSLHADAIAEKGAAHAIRGATIYTLSERASDEQARLAAEKENASDLVAGLETADAEVKDEVRTILFDLMRRETANFSADFSNVVASRLGKSISLSRDPQRSAAFKVLKQTHAPSVLIELGYMSHPEEEKLMNSPAWQTKVAKSLAAAIDAYFAKRTAGNP